MGAVPLRRPKAGTTGFEKAGAILKRAHPELIVSDAAGRGHLIGTKEPRGWNAAIGVLFTSLRSLGLPVRRPPAGQLLYERRKGHFVLQLTGHPDFGLPFGQDRLVPILLATMAVQQKSRIVRFRSGAEILDTQGRKGVSAHGRRLRRHLRRNDLLWH
jgi:hypothetical protein